ncbi:DUF4242 domain-containing protein [Actinopolymorpha sp. B9G3]|uniref:DUF4242 domain-containing protein n=1 Tax=Actinopolymorpha sp. B9G3 TaxID=3158970 RepID=UPI0032D92B27
MARRGDLHNLTEAVRTPCFVASWSGRPRVTRARTKGCTVPKYLIERDVPGAGGLSPEGLRAAAAESNKAVTALSPRVQWQQSYVADDKIFCVYIADDEAVVREHARLSGMPVTVITEIRSVVDPTADTP